MNLYRATYQAPAKSGRLRRMTFAANDDGEAQRIAADWQVRDLLLKVQPVRALQPQLELTGGAH